MYRFCVAVLAAFFALVSLPSDSFAKGKSGPWTVKLSRSQSKGLKDLQSNADQFSASAMAISPDGPWGTAWANTTTDDIKERALRNCRKHVKKGRRDCFVYILNSKVVAPEVVDVKVIKRLYKPVNGKEAPKFFERVPFSFTGNKAAATADFEALKANPAHRASLKQSKALRAALTEASFMNTRSKGFTIWFTSKDGFQQSSVNSGDFFIVFSEWIATPDGLVCMFNSSFWDTGKPAGTRCLIIANAQNGLAEFYWGSSLNSKREGQFIAGDAGLVVVE